VPHLDAGAAAPYLARALSGCEHPPGSLDRLFGARDWITGDPFEIRACRRCGLALTAPRPDAAGMARYYPAAYYARQEGRRFPAPVEWLQRSLYQSRAGAVERLAGRPGRVLDIGCGPGYLLRAFRERGWEVQGTELSEASAAHAREALGIPVHVGPAEAWPWPEGHFDAVVLWHVLEHWPDPGAVIRRVGRLLRPGGILAVGVPNFGSPEAQATRAGWFHLDPPRHLIHLTERSLSGLLAEEGFSLARTSFFAPEYDWFSFVQSALNRLGLRYNLLYDLLRTRGARLLAHGAGGRLQALASLLLAVPLALVGLPASLLLALARRGSAMTAYAVRSR